MAGLNNLELVEFQRVIRLLEEGTPPETPARAELIQKTALAWLTERQRVRRITARR